MHVRTFGTWTATILSIGSGALTQVPEYSFLALPIAEAAGVLWLILLVVFIVRNRSEIGAWTARVLPIHIIILGLAIAVCGAAWQLYRGAQATTAAVPLAPSPTSAPQKRHLTRLDYEERRRILNALYRNANGPIRDVYSIAWGLYNDEPRLINNNQKSVYLELKKIREQLISAYQESAPLMRESEIYSDIRSLNWNFHSLLLGSLNELINTLNVPIENGQTVFIDSKDTDKLKAGIDALGQWIEKTKDAIQKMRSEDDNAEIAGTPVKKTP